MTRETLDFTQPVALMLVAILHFLPDSESPRQIVDTLLDALPSGSYLVASHVTPEHDPEGVGGLVRAYQASGLPAQARAADEFADLVFRGLELVDPGLVLVSEWRPAAPARGRWPRRSTGTARSPANPDGRAASAAGLRTSRIAT